MNLIDRIRRLLTTGANAPTVAWLQEDLSAIHNEITNAEAEASRARSAHDETVLDRIVADDGKALAKSRAAVAAADEWVAELRSAQRALQTRLDAAKQTQRDADHESVHAKLSDLLARRHVVMVRLQSAADELGAALKEANDLGAEAWAMLDPRPPSAFPTIARNDLKVRVQVYLFGITEGLIGTSGETPHKSLSRPDLVAESDGTAQRMLALTGVTQRVERKEVTA